MRREEGFRESMAAAPLFGQNKSSQKTDYAKVICLVYGIDVETNKTKNSKTLSKTTEENET